MRPNESMRAGGAGGHGDHEPALPLMVVERGPVAAAPPRRSRRALRFALMLIPIPLLLATGGVIGLYVQPPGLQRLMGVLGLAPGAGSASPIALPVPPPPAVPRIESVVGLGRLLPKGEVRTIALPFGGGDARIMDLRVREGERVARGDVLAVLDNQPQLEAAVTAARATLAAREAVLSQTLASVAASRDEARATLARAESMAETAEREFERLQNLRDRSVVSQATFDQRRAAREEAQREVERARATHRRYAVDDLREQPDVVVAARNRDAAAADLARAVADLDKAVVRAPVAGTVLTIHVRPGERPGTHGLLNLGNIDEMTVEVEVYQSRIGLVSLGDTVEVTAEALPGGLRGRVTRIGLEVVRQSLTDPSPAANTDARVVRVLADLSPESSAIARAYTNLQVRARIRVGSGA